MSGASETCTPARVQKAEASAITVALAVLALLLAGPGAARPGHDGRLLFGIESKFCWPGCSTYYTVNGDGSKLRALRLADPNEGLGNDSLSPDGSRIAFTVDGPPGPPGALKVRSVARTLERTLAQFQSSVGLIDWSPDSRRIAVATPRQIWVVGSTAARRSARKIVSVTGATIERPHWSPRGTQIAFVRWSPSKRHSTALYVVRPDGSGLQRVVSPRRGSVSGYSWSPDGQRLIVSILSGNALDKSTLQLVDVKTRVSTGFGHGFDPLWGPRGDLIAFELAGRMCIARADGSGREVLGKGQVLAWSPDGRRLAAVTSADSSGLVVMQPDGTGRRTIVRAPSAIHFADWEG